MLTLRPSASGAAFPARPYRRPCCARPRRLRGLRSGLPSLARAPRPGEHSARARRCVSPPPSGSARRAACAHARRKACPHGCRLSPVRQLQQTQRVGDMAAALADDAGDLVLAREFGRQRLVAGRLFHRIEIGALHVFDDRELSASLSLTSITTIGTSCRPARCAARQRRSPAMISKRSCAPLARRTTIGWTMPRSRDRGRQLVELGIGKGAARIARIGLQEFDRHAALRARPLGDARPRRRRRRSGLQGPSQSRSRSSAIAGSLHSLRTPDRIRFLSFARRQLPHLALESRPTLACPLDASRERSSLSRWMISVASPDRLRCRRI